MLNQPPKKLIFQYFPPEKSFTKKENLSFFAFYAKKPFVAKPSLFRSGTKERSSKPPKNVGWLSFMGKRVCVIPLSSLPLFGRAHLSFGGGGGRGSSGPVLASDPSPQSAAL